MNKTGQPRELSLTDHRDQMLKWVRRQLIGPPQSTTDGDEILTQDPLERYTTGILFPVESDESEEELGHGQNDEASDDDDLESMPGDDESEDKVRSTTRRRYYPPSSVGFSFFVSSEGPVELQITVSGATYKRENPAGKEGIPRDESGRFVGRYKRRTFEFSVDWFSRSQSRFEQDSRYLIDVSTRPHQSGQIVTVVLANIQTRNMNGATGGNPPAAEFCIFESGLECEIRRGEVGLYPEVDQSMLTEEEQETNLRYREKRVYAVGHGAAVDWDVESGVRPRIWSNFMPVVTVPQMTAGNIGDMPTDVLRMGVLSDATEWQQVIQRLDEFVDAYDDWVQEQNQIQEKFQSKEREAGHRICRHMKSVLDRMRRGVALLQEDDTAAQAFRLANKAMLNQMRQNDLIRGRSKHDDDYQWYPFQLAFLLTTMESTIREDDSFRQTLDLIWFPTGGGKTEAYLGLIAILIFWRRLSVPTNGGGTVAIMRYTLRLLTRQQFERATRLICSLELLRRKNIRQLGNEPISIGIWVGSAACPNRFKEANDTVKRIEKGDSSARHRLLLGACPWCGCKFTSSANYYSTQYAFEFRCRNPNCSFGTDDDSSEQPILPCNVVDEALYEQPPSLLIATIDKFARLAWEHRANVFFGATGMDRPSNRPPELVIQDELHLVSGPLGSVAGLYEAALETVIQYRGVQPKYIASTATTRMAKEQVRRLYGREVSIFPPPGLSENDSWFARTDKTRPGRCYVGYLAPFLNRQRCLAPLAATLLAAPYAISTDEQDSESLMECWWTAVVYHNSLRDVASSLNAYSVDVGEFVRRLDAEREEIEKSKTELDTVLSIESGRTGLTKREAVPKAADRRNIAQVTSRVSAPENARTFDRLTRDRDDPDCVDAVLTTNMISVGVDVDRLALMVINGQPFMTAEYIQASSRVGRGDVPGIVFVNYFRNQARSLSHYENFRSYHESFHRYVEPTGVTPYTHQVRTRALHAALVIAVRHGQRSLCDNKSAGDADFSCAELHKVTDLLKRRFRKADPESYAETALHLDRLISDWQDRADRCNERKRNFFYETKDNGSDGLLCHFDDADEFGWKTLDSMRNVEDSGILWYHD